MLSSTSSIVNAHHVSVIRMSFDLIVKVVVPWSVILIHGEHASINITTNRPSLLKMQFTMLSVPI